MILTELIFAFFLFLTAGYLLNKNVFVFVYKLFALVISAYLSYALTCLAIEEGFENKIQICFVFYTLCILLFLVLNSVSGKVFASFDTKQAQQYNFAKAPAFIVFGGLFFVVNLALWHKISDSFLLKNSSKFTHYFINQNAFGLFGLQGKKVHKNQEINFYTLFAKAPLSVEQIDMLYKMLNALGERKQKSILNLTHSGGEQKIVAEQIISSYLKIYPLIDVMEVVEIYKIEQIRSSLLYKTTPQSSENLYPAAKTPSPLGDYSIAAKLDKGLDQQAVQGLKDEPVQKPIRKHSEGVFPPENFKDFEASEEETEPDDDISQILKSSADISAADSTIKSATKPEVKSVTNSNLQAKLQAKTQATQNTSQDEGNNDDSDEDANYDAIGDLLK